MVRRECLNHVGLVLAGYLSPVTRPAGQSLLAAYLFANGTPLPDGLLQGLLENTAREALCADSMGAVNAAGTSGTAGSVSAAGTAGALSAAGALSTAGAVNVPGTSGAVGVVGSLCEMSPDSLFARVFAPLLEHLATLLSALSLDSDEFKAVLDVLTMLFEFKLRNRWPICDLVRSRFSITITHLPAYMYTEKVERGKILSEQGPSLLSQTFYCLIGNYQNYIYVIACVYCNLIGGTIAHLATSPIRT